MRCQGIHYGNKIVFNGHSLLYRAPYSQITIGNNCHFNSSSRFTFRGVAHKCIIHTHQNGSIIKIGDNCGFSGTSIIAVTQVRIGNNVLCGADTRIGDADGHSNIYPQFSPKPISIGDNVWLGMNTVVLKGVTIGNNTIIGANSVVTKDIPDNVIAAGNPCKVIRENLCK